MSSTVFTALIILALCSMYGFASVTSFSLLISQTAGSALKSKRLQNLKNSDVLSIVYLIDKFEDQDNRVPTQSVDACEVPDESEEDLDTAKLIDDIDRLTDILGSIIKRENKEIYELYTEFRGLALARSKGDLKALGKMVSLGAKISPENAVYIHPFMSCYS